MLSKHHRLQASSDITQVYRKGKRSSDSGVFLSAHPNNLSVMRVAIVVGKKFSLKATSRNRQKRVLCAAIEQLLPLCTPGYDIVISYTKRESLLSYKESVITLQKIFNNCNLLTLAKL